MLASAGTNDLSIRLWEFPGGKKVRQWRAHQSFISSVAFSSNNKALASAGDGLYLWAVDTGRPFRELQPRDQWFRSVVFSPNGKTLGSLRSDGMIQLWDVETTKLLSHFQGHDRQLHQLAFSPNNQALASGGIDRTVVIWDIDTTKEFRVLKGHECDVGTVAFSPDGKILASADLGQEVANPRAPPPPVDITIRLWQIESGKQLKCLKGHLGTISSLAFTNDGNSLVSGSWDGTVRLWDVNSGKEVRKLMDQAGAISAIAVSPDGKSLAATAKNSIWFWNLTTGKESSECGGHRSPVTLAVFSPGGKTLYSASWDHTCRIWDTSTSRELGRFGNRQFFSLPLSFSADGDCLATAGSDYKDVHVWQLPSGKEFYRLKMGSRGSACCGAFSPDGKTLATGNTDSTLSSDNTVSLWELATAREIRHLNGHQVGLAQLAFSPDGRILVSADRGWLKRKIPSTIILWDVASGKELRRISNPRPTILPPITFSPDGKMFTSGSAGQGLILWEVATGKERIRWIDSRTYPLCLAFSPDGNMLATGNVDLAPPSSRDPESTDRTIRLMDVFTGKEVCQFKGHSGNILSLIFSPVGNTLASTSQDTTILVWDVAGTLTGRDGATEQGTKQGHARQVELSPKILQSLWAALSDDDASKAYEAIGSLVRGGKHSVAFLKDHMPLMAVADPQRLNQLIADLDNADFAKRQQAMEDLAKLAELAQPALEKALASKPSAEVKRRVEPLLEKLRAPITSGPKLRTLRAIEVLEHIGTTKAQEVLQTLAKGAPEALITREAKASLDRLRKLAAQTR
jgi:WD40 repeat protein